MSAATSWFRALLRVLLLRGRSPMPATDLKVIAALVLLALGVWVGIDWLVEQPDPQFYAYNGPDLCWYALALLVLAGVMARLSVPSVSLGRALAMVLAPASVVIITLYLIQSRISSAWAQSTALGALCAYLVLYICQGLRTLSGRWQLKAVAVAALFAACALYATDALLVDPSVWYSAEDTPQDTMPPDEAESLLFSQSGLIDEAVEQMAPSDARAPSAFFIGVAGYAEQRVFGEEIQLAQSVIGSRYGSSHRSLLLVNDRRSQDQAPLATPTALRYALQGVAEKMNLEKDVLFLSLSSHGSPDGAFAISNGTLPMHDLTPGDLASYLKEAGIRWRVIVVSACYSGSFIEPLLSAGTAVITAAAADRTSFGCADDRDLTYFGEAFYRDALPTAGSLSEAFAKTRTAIARREKAEGIDASKPQAYFGPGIEGRLAALQGERPAAAVSLQAPLR